MWNRLAVLVTILFFFSIECNASQKYDSLITDEEQGVKYLEDTNKKLGDQFNKLTEAQWNYATDINSETSDAQVCHYMRGNYYKHSPGIFKLVAEISIERKLNNRYTRDLF